MTLNCTKIIFESKYQNTIDLSQLNFDSEVCSMLCRMLFNKQTSLRHVSTLNVFSKDVSSDCLSTLTDCLQYCCFDCIIVSELDKFSILFSLIIKRILSGKAMFNSILRKPLTLISQPVNTTQNCAQLAATYFVKYKKTRDLKKSIYLSVAQCNAKLHHLLLLNVLSTNEKYTSLQDLYYLQEFVKRDISHIYLLLLYEVGLTDEMVLDIVKILKPIISNAQYVLVSNTLFIVNGIASKEYVQGISNISCIDTVVLEQCMFSQEVFAYLGETISTKMMHLKRITLSKCYEYVDDNVYEKFSKALFRKGTFINYLKELNISHNNITIYLVNPLISSLQSCVIEKLVISNAGINDELCKVLLAKAYNGKSDILNFTNGIPLMINLDNSYAVFVRNCVFSDYYINLLSDCSSYPVCCYNLFVFQSFLKLDHLSHTSPLFLLIEKVTNFRLLGIDFTDKIATIFESMANIEYFLVTDSGVKTNLFRQKSLQTSRRLIKFHL